MKNRLVKIVLVGFLFLCTAPSYAEELSDAKRADIKRLLEVTNALAFGKQMSDAVTAKMSEAIQANRPDIPKKLFDMLREEVNGVIEENLPAFAEKILPNYHRHFTHSEIKKMIAFYETEIGRKMIRTMPELIKEGMAVGQEWGRGLGPEIQDRVLKRFKAEGVDLSA